MSTKKELKRTKQCKNCPWKVSTNPFDIPDGYCEVLTNSRNTNKDGQTGFELLEENDPDFLANFGSDIM